MKRMVIFTLIIALIGGVGATLSILMLRHHDKYAGYQIRRKEDETGNRRYYPVDFEEDGDKGEE